MKVEIAKEKANGTKYIALLMTEKEPVSQKFDTPLALLAFLREQNKLARQAGDTLDIMRRHN